MSEGVSIYVPNAVPQSGDTADLERFLSDELRRIGEAMRLVPVQAMYGGLFLDDDPAPGQVLTTTDAIIEGFDAEMPDNPNRMIPDAVANNITTLESGVVFVMANFNVNVDQNRIYVFTLYADGAETPFAVGLDPSNQTAITAVTLSGFGSVHPGTVFDIRARVDSATGTMILLSGEFIVFRVSELHKDQAFPIA